MDLNGSRCLVTGAAGFIGSHLVERLLDADCQVVGVDCFTDYYSPALKWANLRAALRRPGFRLLEVDLSQADWGAVLDGVDYVFHLAAQPGVRAAWGSRFATYVQHNVLATQRLLEAAVDRSLRRLVFASSSSVYGNTADLPMRETSLPAPASPYGVTKLAAEHLCHLYYESFGLPAVSLRYFTVYGPRQRPDMAFHRFIRSALAGQPITVYGDGRQTRDVTYVADVVSASVLAAARGVPGRVYNVGGGTQVSIADAVSLIGEIVGRAVQVEHRPAAPGDVRQTSADCSAARALGFAPMVGLREGLEAEVRWLREEVATWS